MSQLPLRSVEAFVLVARLLSLSKAATALGITVPAVSRRIQLLERHLGTRLFDRLPRGLALTAAGESYIADLGPAWDAVQAATASARAPSRRNALKVTVIPTFAVNWLLPRLARRRPAGMEIEIETLPDIVDSVGAHRPRLRRQARPWTLGRHVEPDGASCGGLSCRRALRSLRPIDCASPEDLARAHLDRVEPSAGLLAGMVPSFRSRACRRSLYEFRQPSARVRGRGERPRHCHRPRSSGAALPGQWPACPAVAGRREAVAQLPSRAADPARPRTGASIASMTGC